MREGDDQDEVNEWSDTVEEYHAPDGKLFIGFISTLIAHAYRDYLHQFGLKVAVHVPAFATTHDCKLNSPCRSCAK